MLPPEPIVDTRKFFVHSVHRAGRVCLLTSTVLTGVIIVGWVSHVHWMAALIDGTNAMKFNSALATFVFTTAVLVHRANPRSPRITLLARLAGCAVAAAGLATLLEYLLNSSLGIDQVVHSDPWSVGGLAPGRPAPQAALILAALGLALAAPTRWRGVRDGLLVGTVAVALLAIFGELFNVRALVDNGGTYGLTLGASVVTLLAAVGFALTARRRDTTLARLVESTPGGALLRRFIPLLLLPIAAGLAFATLVRSGFVSDSTAAWVVALAAVTVVVATGWRAAESIDRLVDVRTAEHDRLHAIVDALPFVINVFDASGELSDEDLDSTRAPEGERRNLQPLVTAALSGRRQRLAWTDLSTGAARHLEADGVPIIRSGGAVTGAVTVTRDVTELVEAKQRYQTLFDTIPEGLYETSLDGSLLVANEPLAQILGYADVASLLANVGNVTALWRHPEQQKALLRKIAHGMASGTVDIEFIRRDGSTVVVELSFHVVHDALDAPTGLRGTVRDVTADREAAHHAAEADERFRLSFQSGPVGRIILDLRSATPNFAEVNATIGEMLGYTTNELLAADPLSFVHPEDLAREVAALDDCLSGHTRTVDFETRRRHRDGTWIPVRITGGLLRDADGALQYTMTSVEDCRPRLAAAQALDAAARIAERHAEMATALATVAGHILTHTAAADVMGFGADTLVETLGVDVATIYVPNASGELQLIGQSGSDRRLAATTDLVATADTVVAECVRRGSAIVVDDWAVETAYPAPALIAAHGARSAISAPLHGSDDCGGAVIVASIEQRAFASAEIAFVEGIARLLCLAQQNTRAITQLARSEHTLNALVDNAPAAVSLLDTEGRFLLVNRETERVMGAPRSEILGRSREEVAGFSANGDLFRENDRAVAAARRPLTFEETVRFADGDHTYVSVKFPLIDEVGNVFGVGGMSTDITPLKLLQAEADRAWQEAIRRIAIAVEYRDEETGNHIDRMAAYCELIASHLDLGATYAATIRRAAPLHDAGKIAIPDNILLKVGELDIFERAVMETHTEVGYHLLSGTGSDELDLAASIAWTHHERLDGTGYPNGLVGDAIPLEGRIAAVADVFDALTSDRVYHHAISVDSAVEQLRDGRGTSFDADIIDVFVEHLDEAREIIKRYADEPLGPGPRGRYRTRDSAPVALL